MPETKQTLELNLVELVKLATNIFQQMFFKAPKDKSKPLFKEIKSGKSVKLGSMTIQETLTSTLHLSLDHSEFKGPGFNFDVFLAALQGILQQIDAQFKKQGDFNILTGEDGSILLHLPGVVRLGEQYNMMLLAFDLGDGKNTELKLMYVDPDQYKDVLQQETA